MALSSLAAPFLALFMMLGGFNWQYSGQTDDKGTAWVELSADEPLSGVKVKIRGDDGSEVDKTVNIKPGKPTRITWKQKKGGAVSYEIEIEANEAFTSGAFDVVKPVTGGDRKPFTLLSDRVDIVDRQKIRYETPFTITNRELQVYNTDGDLVTEELVADEVVEAGGEFEMSWNTSDEVFMVKVTGGDDSGYSYTDTRVPWAVDIPHTEVNFDSGKSEIKKDEEWKVAEAFAVLVHELAKLDKANEAVNGNLSAQLYIVGYTDTVGKASDNKKLSEARAKSIAKYFYDRGAWCEIHYAGMGEKGLAVETGDSVDEVRNRRALYILGVQKPAGGGQVPSQGSWKKLSDVRPRMLNKLPELPESYVKYKEEQQRKREEKYGGGDGGGGSDFGDDLPEGGGSSGGSGGSSSGGGSSSSSSGGGSGDGPPAVGGDGPGATSKGCSVTGELPEPASGFLGLLGLLGLAGLRQRRKSA
ncbi:OmpA family protein [Plesiocystis pacifica SIR-1]|uniref:OmpA family protein n=1 Tax=Plesiocystis pacifica SIR-1 TaxID=391625 RepID=A6GHH7_9BACT|nr:OmpA family protein [Plesiocystis pacifica]EDM74694.1 OmpA family protein [Plesiocystis pacifica SIR-1]